MSNPDLRPASPEMRRFRLLIAYDGRPFSGWQSQPGGNTIQDLLLDALRSICPEAGTIVGSGRTDAGVSAEGQVAHFDVPSTWSMEGEHWGKALNTKLPATIRVLEATEAAPDFHARFSAREKIYRYRIHTGPVLPPLLAGLAWHRHGTFPAESLRDFLALFEGEHDFRSFSANRNDGKDETLDTRRLITSARAETSTPGQIDIRFQGNGFLYKMVRFLVGTTVYGIEGRMDRSEVMDLLSGSEPDRKAPYCAPPDGLTLEKVLYVNDTD
jgi:tRNA pseudouridine38-40 synthase